MGTLSRADRAVAVGLIGLLLVLLGLAVAHRSDAARPVAPVGTPSPPTGAALRGNPPPTAAPSARTPGGPTTSSPATSATTAAAGRAGFGRG